MDRRGFIRQTIGGNASFQKALLWAGILLVILLIIKSDLVIEPSSIFSLLKIATFLFVALVALTIIVLVINFLAKKILEIIPPGITAWFKKYGKTIDYLLRGALYVCIIYYIFHEKKYSLIFIYSVFVLSSIYFKWIEKQNKKE